MKKMLYIIVSAILISVLGIMGYNFVLWKFLTKSSEFSWKFTNTKGRVYTGTDDLRNTEIDKFISTSPSGRMAYNNNKSKLICRYDLLEGKKHGNYKCWDNNGLLVFNFNYDKGVQHGKQESWWPNGSKMTFKNYIDGRLEGTFTNWYENGQVSTVNVYSNNLSNGRSLNFTQDGLKIGDCIESNGFTISGTRIISKDGDHKILLGTFENGVLKKQWYYVGED